MLVTLRVSKCPKGWLNARAFWKNWLKLVALLVFQPVKGRLKLTWFMKTCAKDVTRLTHQVPMSAPYVRPAAELGPPLLM
jgi:hypothetical protein